MEAAAEALAYAGLSAPQRGAAALCLVTYRAIARETLRAVCVLVIDQHPELPSLQEVIETIAVALSREGVLLDPDQRDLVALEAAYLLGEAAFGTLNVEAIDHIEARDIGSSDNGENSDADTRINIDQPLSFLDPAAPLPRERS